MDNRKIRLVVADGAFAGSMSTIFRSKHTDTTPVWRGYDALETIRGGEADALLLSFGGNASFLKHGCHESLTTNTRAINPNVTLIGWDIEGDRNWNRRFPVDVIGDADSIRDHFTQPHEIVVGTPKREYGLEDLTSWEKQTLKQLKKARKLHDPFTYIGFPFDENEHLEELRNQSPNLYTGSRTLKEIVATLMELKFDPRKMGYLLDAGIFMPEDPLTKHLQLSSRGEKVTRILQHDVDTGIDSFMIEIDVDNTAKRLTSFFADYMLMRHYTSVADYLLSQDPQAIHYEKLSQVIGMLQQKIPHDQNAAKEGEWIIPSLMTPVLYNLLLNSRDTALKETIRTRENENSVSIIVEDDGIGIEPEVMPEIFGEYSRYNNRQGKGQGLQIVKDIVESLGGTIEVTSKTYGGKTHFFSLRSPSEPAIRGGEDITTPSGTRMAIELPFVYTRNLIGLN